jgi:tetratricopeptide (TPR) repeat protein
LFDLEWSNIQAGQAWAAAQAEQDTEAARLCSRYPEAGSYCLGLRQHPRERIRWLQTALAAARQLKDRPSEGRHLGEMGIAYDSLGDYRRAIEYYEQHLAIARETGDREGEAHALGHLGSVCDSLGDYRRAIEYENKCIVIAREIGLPGPCLRGSR